MSEKRKSAPEIVAEIKEEICQEVKRHILGESFSNQKLRELGLELIEMEKELAGKAKKK